MRYALFAFIGFTVVVIFLVIAVFPVFRLDKRRWERRRRRLFAPVERRRKDRRHQGSFADLRWALRYRRDQFRS